MVFSSLAFIFCFLPLMIFSYYISPRKYKNLVLLIGSLLFYAYGGIRFLGIILVSIIFNYSIGILINEYRDRHLRKVFLILGILLNIGMLAYFKYFNFFIDNYNSFFGGSFTFEKVILPIGISFFTFQSLSYIIDVYNGDKPQENLANMALYIALFPQLIAGPIVRYSDISLQLIKRRESINLFGEGVERFILGLAKKVLLANVLGEVASDIFEGDSISVFLSWVGITAYALQIYYDFSGYSDMAIGLGRMFGFKFLENFNYPYISRSISEFFRRWHISLGRWFRDYVYIPLGGSRKGIIKTCLNLIFVWVLTGLWHGAAWTFVLWGLYFGIIICIEKAFLLKFLNSLPRFISNIYTIFLVLMGWVIFRSENLSSMEVYFKSMFHLNEASLINYGDLFYISNYRYEFLLGFLFVTPFIKNLLVKLENSNNKIVSGFFSIVFTPIALIGILYLVIMTLTNTSFNPFIYFRF